MDVIGAEDERGAPDHDPHDEKQDGNEEPRGDRGEGLREGHEEQDQDEDEPDVVRLPDRGEGLLDGGPLLLRPWPMGDDVEDSAPEVGPTGQAVDHQRDDDHARDQVGRGHRAAPVPGVRGAWTIWRRRSVAVTAPRKR